MKLFGLSLWGWFFYNNEKLLNILLSILFITLCAFLGFLIASFYKKKKKQYENHEDIKLSIGEFFKRYKYVIVLVLIVLFSFVTINFISSIKNPGLLCEKVIGSSDLKELEKLNGDSDIIIFDDDTLKELKLEELLNDPESTSRMLQICKNNYNEIYLTAIENISYALFIWLLLVYFIKAYADFKEAKK